MIRRNTCLAAALAGLTLLASGCVTSGSGSEPAPKAAATSPVAELSGRLEVVSYQPKGSSMWDRYESLASEFESDHPGVEVKLTFGGGSGIPPIAARYKAGNPPDVNPTIAGANGEYVKAGRVMDLTPVLDRQLDSYGTTWRDAMYPGVLPFLTNKDDGEVYGLPESITTVQFFYNKKMFEDLGVQPPQTLDELFSVCDALKAKGVDPFAVTGTFNFYLEMYYDYLLLRYAGADAVESALGGPMVSDGESTDFADIDGVREASQKLQEMVDKGYFMKGFESTDFTAAQLAFFQGKTAMILMGSWLPSEMAGKIPDGFQLGTFAFPTVSGGQGDQDATFGSVQSYEISAKAPNPDAAIAWLQFLASKDNQESYVADENVISAYQGVSTPETFAGSGDKLGSGAIVPSYFDLFNVPTSVQEAYQGPIAKVFFGQEDAGGLVHDISQGLSKAH